MLSEDLTPWHAQWSSLLSWWISLPWKVLAPEGMSGIYPISHHKGLLSISNAVLAIISILHSHRNLPRLFLELQLQPERSFCLCCFDKTDLEAVPCPCQSSAARLSKSSKVLCCWGTHLLFWCFCRASSHSGNQFALACLQKCLKDAYLCRASFDISMNALWGLSDVWTIRECFLSVWGFPQCGLITVPKKTK